VEQLNLLGVALGLAALAGINLYLTVFVTGLAINQHWITLSPQYQSLEVLGTPVILIVAGVLYVLEFFADKVPWIDSAWDAVHTIIRPIGGALLAIQVLGDSTPTYEVLVLLLAGGTSLVTHTAKASSRLMVNTSPEPFSNIGVSLIEDAAVFGGLALIHYNPVMALAIFGVVVLLFLYFAPKIIRAMKAKIWLVFKKLNIPADGGQPIILPSTLPGRLGEIFTQDNILHETIAWAVPCLSGRGRRIPPNLHGSLVATNEEPRKLVFVHWQRPRLRAVDRSHRNDGGARVEFPVREPDHFPRRGQRCSLPVYLSTLRGRNRSGSGGLPAVTSRGRVGADVDL
jgi:hypothetical protein